MADERILVCVNESRPSPRRLVRAGKRMAERARHAVDRRYSADAKHEGLPDSARRLPPKALQLAEPLAPNGNLHADPRIAAELDRLRARPNVSRLLIGRPRPRGPCVAFGREAVADQLLDAAKDFEVTIIAGEAPAPAWRQWPTISLSWQAAAAGLGGAPCRDADRPGHRLLPARRSRRHRRWSIWSLCSPSGRVTASCPRWRRQLVSFLSYNFFFTAPRYSFTIAQAESVIAIVIFLIGALFTGKRSPAACATGYTADQPEPHRKCSTTSPRRIAAKSDLDDVLYAGAYHIAATPQLPAR